MTHDEMSMGEAPWQPVLRDWANETTPVSVGFLLQDGHNSLCQLSGMDTWVTTFPDSKDALRALATLERYGSWYHQQEDSMETEDDMRAMYGALGHMRDHIKEIFVGRYEEVTAKLAEWEAEL